MKLEPGTRLARYEIVEMFGKGGLGEGYRATNTRLPRPQHLHSRYTLNSFL
jgi:hypothetical protein